MRFIHTFKYLLIILVAFSATSCSRAYKIEGTSSIRLLDGKKLYVKTFANGAWNKVDSTEIVHGAFSMKGKTDSAFMAMLFMDNNAILPLIIEKGDIRVTLTNSTFSVKGTPMNDSLYNLIDKRIQYDTKLEDLKRKEARMMMSGYSLAQIHKEIATEEERIIFEKRNYSKEFIMRNYNNLLGPNTFVIICSLMKYPMLTPMTREVLQDAPESFTSNELVQRFLTIAQENQEIIDARNAFVETTVTTFSNHR